MTRETLEWLLWLVSQQVVNIGAEGAEDTAARAFRAKAELETELKK